MDFNKLTTKSQQAVAAAQELARRRGNPEITPDHLLLALLDQDLFADWLGRHFPDRKDRVLGRLREARRGKLNDSTFGRRMRGEGAWADVFSRMFKLHRQRVGMAGHGMELSAAHFTTGRPRQGELFE